MPSVPQCHYSISLSPAVSLFHLPQSHRVITPTPSIPQCHYSNSLSPTVSLFQLPQSHSVITPTASVPQCLYSNSLRPTVSFSPPHPHTTYCHSNFLILKRLLLDSQLWGLPVRESSSFV
ncbi:hypothetical protein BsWGS_00127 [Bradybaena similaris]